MVAGVLSPHHVRVIGLPTAIPSKLSTLNATAWTCRAKRRPAANMDRRVNDQNMMNERDKECRRLRILMLSMLIARWAQFVCCVSPSVAGAEEMERQGIIK